MKYITKILLFISAFFLINLVFYYSSEDYRFLLKKLKNTDEVVYIEDKNITDDYIEKETILDENITETNNTETDEKIVFNDTNSWIDSHIENKEITEKETEIILWKQYKEIYDLFSKDYDLWEIRVKQNIFDITDEFPDDYLEYYSTDLTLYLFLKKNYSQIKDIFDVIAYNSPYKINEVNNFWDNSFYINLDENISDSYIRMIISYESVVFWLKIKKDEYNNVTKKLNTLKK